MKKFLQYITKPNHSKFEYVATMVLVLYFSEFVTFGFLGLIGLMALVFVIIMLNAILWALSL